MTVSQLTLYNAPSPLPDRPQLRQERHPCSNQNQRSSSPVVGGLFTDPRSSSGPRRLPLPSGAASRRFENSVGSCGERFWHGQGAVAARGAPGQISHSEKFANSLAQNELRLCLS